jgi:hypothetical protein
VNLLVGEQRSKAYLAVNPQGKVPAIRVQGECLWAESAKSVVTHLTKSLESLLDLRGVRGMTRFPQYQQPWHGLQLFRVYPGTGTGTPVCAM